MQDWKPVYCFDYTFLGGDTYPSIYGDPFNRHNDFKSVMFEVGPCVGAGCTNITEAKRQDELNKLEFVFLYNNERFDLTARDKDLVVKESIV